MLKNNFWKLRMILILAVFLTSCGMFSSPKSVTEKYFKAVKTGDLKTAVECMSPNIQAQYNASVAFSNTLLGLMGIQADSDALLGGLFAYSGPQSYEDYEFKVSDSYQIDSSHAVVMVDVYINGIKDSTTKMPCVKIDHKWYLEE